MPRVPKHRRQFGERVRDLREERGLSQERLGERAGVHRNGIGVIERGQNAPTLDTIVALAKGLGVSLEDLFRGL